MLEHEEPDERNQDNTPKESRGDPPLALPLDEMLESYKDLEDILFEWSGINKGGYGYVIGSSKSGKTIFCECLGMAIASGQTQFLKKPLAKKEESPEKVLFVSCEEFPSARIKRNEKQAAYFDKLAGSAEWRKNYHVVTEAFPRFIHSSANWKTLVKLLLEQKPDIVFIDSLTRLTNGQIEDSKTANALMMKLRELSYLAKCTLVVIHHTPKQMGKPLTIDSVAGSRVLIQEADFCLGINRTSSGTRYVKEIVFRYKQEEVDKVTLFAINDTLIIEAQGEKAEWEVLGENDGRSDPSNLMAVYKSICEKPEGKTTKELMDEFVKTGIIGRSTLYPYLKQLTEEMKIIKEDKTYKKLDLFGDQNNVEEGDSLDEPTEE
ncbi:AAA domain-containing protein [Catalinimonas alkaloidigena]|uniref:AAA domain-containing protein n=1 Tax=Catalinimonas alkaloidigena TaxID=1075417 RepID=A0A1G9BVR6_9BACT|nr:AAA family ATPase [Catalinimonas alkaloidigena]SDK43065.1 AAA domain-containing protein [Catalinimonas alkaloidigena]